MSGERIQNDADYGDPREYAKNYVDKRNFCQKLCCCAPNVNDKYDSDNDERGKEDKYAPNPDFRKVGEHKNYTYNGAYARVRKLGRVPTDCQCTVLFAVFLVILLGIAIYGFVVGNPERLYRPTDYTGRVCGQDNTYNKVGSILFPNNDDCQKREKNSSYSVKCEEAVKVARQDLTDQKYLWFMDISQGLLTYGGVCVSYCPGSGSAGQSFCPPELNLTKYTIPLVNITYSFCSYTRYDVTNTSFPVGDLGKLIEGTISYKPFILRCLPTFKYQNVTGIKDATALLKNYLNEGFSLFGNLINDVYRSWLVIIACCILSILFAFGYLIFLRIFAGIVVWTTLISLFVILEGLAAFTIWYGYTTWKSNDAAGLDVVVPQIIFYVGISIGVIGLIYALIVLFMALRIRKSIGMIQEAVNAIAAMPQIVAVPFVITIIIVIYAAWWLCVAGFLWSTGTASIEGFTVRFRLDIAGQVLFYLHIFGFLWISNFFIALCQVIVAGAIGSWYWNRNKKLIDPRAFYVLNSTKRALVFHVGSIAFGSCIVAIIQFLRILFEKVYSELKKGMANNKIWKGVAWAVRIFLWIFETLVKYINKHAYVQVALYGSHFIKSAINAFTILTRNFLQIGTLQVITTATLTMGKLLVSVFTCLIAYLLAWSGYLLITDRNTQISSPLLVAVICFVLSFVISSIFIHIVDTAIDTVLQCFLIDYEMCYNDSTKKPYCTRTLAVFIKEHQFIDKLEKFVCQCCCCVTGACNRSAGETDPSQALGNAPSTNL